jgi:hypothetical protein
MAGMPWGKWSSASIAQPPHAGARVLSLFRNLSETNWRKFSEKAKQHASHRWAE